MLSEKFFDVYLKSLKEQIYICIYPYLYPIFKNILYNIQINTQILKIQREQKLCDFKLSMILAKIRVLYGNNFIFIDQLTKSPIQI